MGLLSLSACSGDSGKHNGQEGEFESPDHQETSDETLSGEGSSSTGKILEVHPRYQSNPLNEYPQDVEEGLFLFEGDENPQKMLNKHVLGSETPSRTLPQDITVAVFRGVFSTGGYDLDIKTVKLKEDQLIISARYLDPAKNQIVPQMLTAPTAFFSVTLPQGSYQVVLRANRKTGDQEVEAEKIRDQLTIQVTS